MSPKQYYKRRRERALPRNYMMNAIGACAQTCLSTAAVHRRARCEVYASCTAPAPHAGCLSHPLFGFCREMRTLTLVDPPALAETFPAICVPVHIARWHLDHPNSERKLHFGRKIKKGQTYRKCHVYAIHLFGSSNVTSHLLRTINQRRVEHRSVGGGRRCF